VFEGLLEPAHLLLILFVALLVFGPQKIPDLGKAIGESIRELKRALSTPDNNNSSSESPLLRLADQRDESRSNEKPDD